LSVILLVYKYLTQVCAVVSPKFAWRWLTGRWIGLEISQKQNLIRIVSFWILTVDIKEDVNFSATKNDVIVTRKLCVSDKNIVLVWTEVKWICCLLTDTTIGGLTSSSYMLPIFTKLTCTFKYITYSSTYTCFMYRCIYAHTLHVI